MSNFAFWPFSLFPTVRVTEHLSVSQSRAIVIRRTTRDRLSALIIGLTESPRDSFLATGPGRGRAPGPQSQWRVTFGTPHRRPGSGWKL
eukprot:763340-Hanusia_phi.AAC.10